jgi:hypothetical protein
VVDFATTPDPKSGPGAAVPEVAEPPWGLYNYHTGARAGLWSSARAHLCRSRARSDAHERERNAATFR